LCLGALVAPDKRGANDFVLFIEKNGAVHLAGEADGRDGITGKFGGFERFANGEASGAPPVARILLGPAGFGAGKVGMFFRAGGENRAAVVEDDRTSATGSDVDA